MSLENGSAINFSPKVNLIGIAGRKRSGKDTVGKILSEKYGYKKLYFAEYVYKGVYTLNPLVVVFRDKLHPEQYRCVRLQAIVDEIGWEKAKEYDEIRRFLQVFGTEAGRDIHGENCWVNLVEKQINPKKLYVITDVRFQSEVDMIKKHNGILIKVERKLNYNHDLHSSEQGITGYTHIIDNNGTLLELEEKVTNLITSLTCPQN